MTEYSRDGVPLDATVGGSLEFIDVGVECCIVGSLLGLELGTDVGLLLTTKEGTPAFFLVGDVLETMLGKVLESIDGMLECCKVGVLLGSVLEKIVVSPLL